ncbi:type 2 isopentenyl-diphosphate Delta-isomerase [Cohnella thailandensis]|uniref:Isopentenyl-diphosphate delta-isomerase n=1 Tax=Cohnella thailandensis TaxID=557557 RepID=A0A841T8D3_9BACL|nr:type 2 isopentenyl-diphosphate Delta-isomerase [Cohnella thailandensis]MBB6638320.1 type 2 isopentenyl-diphosphate Delta-isomerase [Cohnella thailandensis]MBP1977202.1 isopentenyl-diphosphate delta-isomerase [Cohnella thailandensis]
MDDRNKAEPGTGDTGRRKNEHIEISLKEDVNSRLTSGGFDRYRFRHQALPEVSFERIDTSASFLGRRLAFPLLISSMTGGTEEAARINRHLAEVAEKRGWALALGSGRAALEKEEAIPSFQMRRLAPSVPILANLGAVQLSLGYDADDCRRLVELAGADGLVLHLNGLQEIFQPEGDTDFSGLLRRIEKICREAEFPVGVKEVGWGIDGGNARRLLEAGVRFIDVAGAGGTSWSQVEKMRLRDEVRRLAADSFADWGIPTAECIVEARRAAPSSCLIGSGGVKSGIDAAKALALGADLAGFGRSLLAHAVDSADSLDLRLSVIEFELRAAMFGIGAPDLSALRTTDRLTAIG